MIGREGRVNGTPPEWGDRDERGERGERAARASIQLNVRITPRLHERLRDLAAQQERSLAEVVNEALVQWIDAAAPTQDATELEATLRAPERLEALARTGLMDSPVEETFDRLARYAADTVNAPGAIISLVASDRQFLKSQRGLPEPWATARQTPLSHSFCQYVVASGEPLIIGDARTHPLGQGNLAPDDLGVIAYAGVPLTDGEGHVLGSLCAVDGRPRTWTPAEVDVLEEIGQVVSTEINVRMAAREAVREESDRRFGELTAGQREVRRRGRVD